MKKVLLALVVLLGLVFGAWQGYLLYYDFDVKPAPPAVLASEQALAAPGLLVLASADVAHLADLDRKFRGEPDDLLPPSDDEYESMLTPLLRAGINPRKSISHALVGVFITETGSFATTLILHGEFPAEVLTNFITEQYVTEQEVLHDFNTLKFYKEDKDYCEPPKQWQVSFEPKRIIITDSGMADTVYKRLRGKTAAAFDLSWWRYFRSTHLAGVMAFAPNDESAISNPLLRGPVAAAKTKLADFHSVYLGAKVKPLPPALNLTMWLATNNDQTAFATAQQWMAEIENSKNKWQALLPTVASLHDVINVSMQPNAVVAQADLDKAWVEKLAEVPVEIINSMFGSLGLESSTPSTATANEERLEQNPIVYYADYPTANLAEYDPETDQAGPVDIKQGPFGARIQRISLTDEPETGFELDITGLSTNIGNLGSKHERVHLVIKNINSVDGADLLIGEPCGINRNSARVIMKPGFSHNLLSATKTVRLRPSAKMSEIKEIIGQFELKLPVKTQSKIVNNPTIGTKIEQDGARVSVTRIQGNKISYNYSGATQKILEVRALNSAGKPLMQVSSFSGDMFFGGGKFASVEYTGKIAQLEAVFATRIDRKEFPFTLVGNRPTAVKDQVVNDSPDFSSQGIVEIKKRFGKAAPAVPTADRLAKSVATSGPFTIILKDMASFTELRPHIKLLSPQIPNVKESLAAIVLTIKQIRLNSGKTYTAPKDGPDRYKWLNAMTMSETSQKDYLENSVYIETGLDVKPEEVSHILGEITMYVPTSADTFLINNMEVGNTTGNRGVDVTIHALHRDKIELRSLAKVERILRVRALNADNKELWITFPKVEQTVKGWQGIFPVHGAPHQLEIAIPRTLSNVSYPFTLRLN